MSVTDMTGGGLDMPPGEKPGEVRVTARGQRFVWTAYWDEAADELRGAWLWVP